MEHLKIPNRADVAESVGTSDQYLYQIETRRRLAGRVLAIAIERATGGGVTRQHLRPDVFGAPPEPIERVSAQEAAA